MPKQPEYVQSYIRQLEQQVEHLRGMLDVIHGNNEKTECFWYQTLDIGKYHPLPEHSQMSVMVPGKTKNHRISIRKAYKDVWAEISSESVTLRIEPRATNLFYVFPEER
jgi:hypothetical protein